MRASLHLNRLNDDDYTIYDITPVILTEDSILLEISQESIYLSPHAILEALCRISNNSGHSFFVLFYGNTETCRSA